jgi:voltage-gated potassium channel Kch
VSVIPHCRVTSPADVALPSLVAAALADDLAGVVADTEADGWTGFGVGGAAPTPFEVPRRTRWLSRIGLLQGQLRPHDSGSLILLMGLAGILLLLTVDTLAGLLVLHETPIGAFHAAVRTVATVGPVPIEEDHPGYLLFAALAMLVTIGLTAMFTAGIVEHLLSGRLIAIWGRRVLPRRGHVVVVGMGQVGLRLAEEIRRHGLGVVGIERFPSAPHLRTARSLNIPVLVGDGSRRRVLSRARVDHAVALCAVASDELDNVAVAVTARAVAPDLRVVMRAGNHDAIAETQSLFRIGTVVDTTGLTAAYVVRCLTDARPRVVLAVGSGALVVDRASGSSDLMPTADDCGH